MTRQLAVFSAILFGFSMTPLIGTASFADEPESPAATQNFDDIELEEIQTSVPDVDPSVEEVTVYGTMSSSRLAIRFKRAQFAFLDLYNSLNTNEEFRVICEKRAMVGSNIKKDRCEPAYYREAQAEAFQNSVATQSVGRGGTNFNNLPAGGANFANLTRGKRKEAVQHMISLVESNPELRKRYEELVKTQLAYEQSKAPEKQP